MAVDPRRWLQGGLPPDIADVLQRAGWFPDRQVPTARWVDGLVAEGYPVYPVTEQILSTLGGLKLVPIARPDRHQFFPDSVDFEPIDAASGERDKVEDWERIAETGLSPIGTVFRDWILLVTEGGTILAGRGRDLDLIGESIEDALLTLVRADRKGISLSPDRPRT